MSGRQSVLKLPSTATKSLLLLLLLADTPVPKVQATYGTYHDIFLALVSGSIEERKRETGLAAGAGWDITVESYDTVQQQYPTDERLAQADAVLITGSASSAYLPEPWIVQLIGYVRLLPSKAPSTKIIGICFGHQIVALAFGGTCVKNERGWEIGVREIELSEAGRTIWGVDKLGVQQMHQDHVPAVPAGFASLGSTPVCPVHGLVRLAPSADSPTSFKLEQIQVITLQGHPEFHADMVSRIIDTREGGGVISHELAEASRGHAKDAHDGIRIGRTLLGMLGV